MTLKIIFITISILILAYIIIAKCSRPHNYKLKNPMMKDSESSMPLLIAHGGGNKEFPDNTLEAFYNAYSVDERVMLETDVSITKDGVVILSHDVTLDRKTNVSGAIADWNYSDLMEQKVDFGYTNPTKGGALNGERKHFTGIDGIEKYPTDVSYPQGVQPRDKTVFLATTLEELLVSFPKNKVNVEIKQGGALGKKAFEEIVRILKKHDAFGRVVLAIFNNEKYDEIKLWQKAGKVPEEFMYSPGTGGAAKFFVLQLLNLDLFFTDKMCVFQIPMEGAGFNLATKKLIDSAHKHNLAVHYWTIDNTDKMKFLISIGADGIMTNYPHKLKEVYNNNEK